MIEKPNLNKPAFKMFPEAKKRIESNSCAICNQKINEKDFKDRLSEKEYSISGMCQSCQDKTFGE